jgi:hypothetical protein
MSKEFKHGSELREFWRVQKAKYRARRKEKQLAERAKLPAQPNQPSTPTHEELVVHG